MEADIRKLSKRQNGDDSDDEPAKKKAKSKSYLEEELAKYSKGRDLHRKDKKKDESDVLAALTSFRTKLKSTTMDEEEGDGEKDEDATEEGAIREGEDPGIEVDDDTGFLSHHLSFPKGNDEEVQKAERDYEVIDPRQRGARAREEERERKKAMKPRDGGRGSRR